MTLARRNIKVYKHTKLKRIRQSNSFIHPLIGSEDLEPHACGLEAATSSPPHSSRSSLSLSFSLCLPLRRKPLRNFFMPQLRFTQNRTIIKRAHALVVIRSRSYVSAGFKSNFLRVPSSTLVANQRSVLTVHFLHFSVLTEVAWKTCFFRHTCLSSFVNRGQRNVLVTELARMLIK